MQNRKLIYFLLIILILVAIIFSIIVLANKRTQKTNVYFLDVGQGDAILVSNGNNQVLIDAGRNGKIVLEKLGKSMPFWDRKIEAIIITHPDADHYGGFNDVLDFYKVENVIRTEADNDSGEWLVLLDKIKDKKINEIRSVPNLRINFPSGAELDILYPKKDIIANKNNSNNSSIVSRLVFGENKFLFTGDLSVEGEKILLDENIDIKADFLKIAHHGSQSGTTDEFLEKVKPKDAIISVGKNNSYGHPHKEIIDRLQDRLIRIWRTDQDGTIRYFCPKIIDTCQAQKI